MTKQEFNTIEEMHIYNGRRSYSVKDIDIIEKIYERVSKESYKVRGCSVCLMTLKNKLWPYYIEKKQQIENGKSKSKGLDGQDSE